MAKKEEQSTAVAATETTAVAQYDDHQIAMLEQYAEDSGQGFEEASMDSFAVPFLQILQALSPQCKRSDGAYIPDAEEGMFINTVTQRLYDGEEGILVVPFYYTQRFIEWGVREKGGGFKGEFLPSDAMKIKTHRDERGRDIIDARPESQLVDTRTHYVLINEGGVWSPAIIAFSSTQVKKSKQWMSRMQQITVKHPQTGEILPAPMASRMWRLTSVPESNEQGSWYGFKIGNADEHFDGKLYALAIEMREAVKSGRARVQYAQEGDDEPSQF